MLQDRWCTHHRISEKTTAVTFHPAQLDDWEIPKDKKGRPACKVTHVAPVNSCSDESDIDSSDKEEPLTKCAENKEKPLEMKMRYP